MDKPKKYEAEYKKEAIKLAKEVGAKDEDCYTCQCTEGYFDAVG